MSQDSMVAAIIALVIFIVISGFAGWKTYSTYQLVYEVNEQIDRDDIREAGLPPLGSINGENMGKKQEFYLSVLDMHEKEAQLKEQIEVQKKAKDKLAELEFALMIAKDDQRRMKLDYEWYKDRQEENTTYVSSIKDPSVRFDLPPNAPVGADPDNPDVQISQGADATTVTVPGMTGAIERIKDEALSKRQAVRNKNDTDYNEQRNKVQTEIEDIQQHILVENTKIRNIEQESRTTTAKELTAYQQVKAELEKIISRERQFDQSADGSVVAVDLVERMLVINRGRANRVMPGFRFEVYQVKGGRDVHKGWIEVKEASQETATCVILHKKVLLPTDPGTSYVAKNPEERFSPYVTRGDRKVQALNGPPKVVWWGLNQEDPIVSGDLIRNPFYHPRAPMRFFVDGEPIKYGKADVARIIKRYGGIVDDELSAGTDYLVAGKWAHESVKKAIELGVKVFYEFELFRFLSPDLG
jgi:hypothetical protein